MYFTDKESECHDRSLVGTIHSQQPPAGSARSLHSRPLPINLANTGRTYTTRTRTRSFPQPHSLPVGSAHTSRTHARSLPTHGHTTPPPVQRARAGHPRSPKAGVPCQTWDQLDREVPARRPFSSMGAADAWGPAGVRGAPPHHQAPHLPPHSRAVQVPLGPTLTLQGSPAGPSARGPGGQGSFPTSSWRPGKDEPGGGGGDAHAQREDATVREAGELELSLGNLGWKSGSTLRKRCLTPKL